MEDKPWLKRYDSGVPYTIDYPPVPLFYFLEESARKYPDSPCTIFKGAKISYREMNELSDQLAAGLASLGIKKGDRVGLFMPNTPQFVMAYFAILKIGGVVVEAPLKNLREKYRDLPRLINEISDDVHTMCPPLRQFETFTSAGRVFGNVPVDEGPRIISLLTDYAALYSSYVRGSSACDVLEREHIHVEAADTLGRFMMMMAEFDFSEDMPNQPKRSA